MGVFTRNIACVITRNVTCNYRNVTCPSNPRWRARPHLYSTQRKLQSIPVVWKRLRDKLSSSILLGNVFSQCGSRSDAMVTTSWAFTSQVNLSEKSASVASSWLKYQEWRFIIFRSVVCSASSSWSRSHWISSMSVIDASFKFLLENHGLIYTHTTTRLKRCSPCSSLAVGSITTSLLANSNLNFIE